MSNNEYQHQPISAEHGVAASEESETVETNPVPEGGESFEQIGETPAPEETAEEKIARLEAENQQLRQQSGV